MYKINQKIQLITLLNYIFFSYIFFVYTFINISFYLKKKQYFYLYVYLKIYRYIYIAFIEYLPIYRIFNLGLEIFEEGIKKNTFLIHLIIFFLSKDNF